MQESLGQPPWKGTVVLRFQVRVVSGCLSVLGLGRHQVGFLKFYIRDVGLESDCGIYALEVLSILSRAFSAE